MGKDVTRGENRELVLPPFGPKAQKNPNHKSTYVFGKKPTLFGEVPPLPSYFLGYGPGVLDFCGLDS
jgi:hypothetical protein